MMIHSLRAVLTANGTIELLDPLPEGLPPTQEVSVVFEADSPTLYQRINEYGDTIWVDTVNGIEYPENPISLEQFFQTYGPIWADRQNEITDSVTWIKQQREAEAERDDAWRGQTLS